MDLGLTDEQQHLVDAFRSLYTSHGSMDRVRAAEPAGFDKALWEQLLEIGVIPMAVSEDHGGWGASLLDLVLVAEQHGRSVAPAPLIEAQVGARLLDRSAAATSRRRFPANAWSLSGSTPLLGIGMTIVLIDHDMHLVLSLCDTIYVLDFGRIIAEGPPAAIKADRTVAAAYLGQTHAAVLT